MPAYADHRSISRPRERAYALAAVALVQAALGFALLTGLRVQVSRSGLINIDAIAELQEMFKGDLVAIMKGGQEVPVSRRFRTQVMDRLAG